MKETLSTMSPSTVASYILGIIILAISIATTSRYLKTKRGREEFNEFLDEINGVVKNEILKWLINFDFAELVNNSSSVLAAETKLLSDLYDRIAALVNKHLNEAYGDNPLYTFIMANLSRESIRSFSEFIVGSDAVQNIISDKVVKVCQKSMVNGSVGEALEAEYELLNKKIETNTLVEEGEEVQEINLEEAMPDPEPIIPPTEDGEDFDDDIDEVVSEKIEETSFNEVAKAIAADDEE